MKLHTRLNLERLKGREIEETMKNHGWKRCKFNNEFNKGDFNAYFYFPFLIFNHKQPLKHFHKMKLWDYKIFEGKDHFNNAPLWQVVGIDNEYIGEWHSQEKEALKELTAVAAA